MLKYVCQYYVEIEIDLWFEQSESQYKTDLVLLIEEYTQHEVRIIRIERTVC